jgi:purine-cytosine permease-like protein
MRSVSITKFASLNAVQVVAMTGALAAGVTTTALAIYTGVLLADMLHHRKPFAASWINATREMVTLYAAYGVYAALAIRVPEMSSGHLVPEAVPAIAAFFLSYFVLSIPRSAPR